MSSMINFIFIVVILAVAFWMFQREEGAIKAWQAEFRELEQAIKILRKNKEKGVFVAAKSEEKSTIQWLAMHFQGQYNNGNLELKQENGFFVLLAYPQVLSKAIPRSPVHFAPTLLTALGILGTFTGIIIGLWTVNLENSNALLTESTQLLEGMKLAFSTSFVGLFLAIVFMVILYLGGESRKKYRHHVGKKLRDLAVRESPNRLLSPLNTQGSGNIAEVLESLVESLKSLTQLNGDVIGRAVGKELAPIVQELKQMGELQATQGQTVESLMDSLRAQFIEPVLGRLEESANLTKVTAENIEQLSNSVSGMTGGAAEVAEAFQNIPTIIRDTNKIVQEELAAFRQEYQNRLQEFLQKQQNELKTIMGEMGVVLQEDLEKREKLIKEIPESMEQIQQAVKVSSQLAHQVGLHDSQVLEDRRKFFESVGENALQITQQYETMVERFNQTLESGNQELTSYLQQANESYQKSIAEGGKGMVEACQQLNNTANNLKLLAEYLVAAAKELNQSNK